VYTPLPFRSFDLSLYLHRAAAEQYSGIGCTVLLLLIFSWLAAKWDKRRLPPVKLGSHERLVRICIWIAFFVFMAKAGINLSPRYLASYYPLLLASLLLGTGHLRLIHSRWWRHSALAVTAASIGLVVLSMSRPFFPAHSVLRFLEQGLGNKPFLRKIMNKSTSDSLRNGLNALLAKIPENQHTIGYAVRTGNNGPWLWKPFFSRRVERVLNSDAPEELLAQGIEYVVVDRSALTPKYDQAIVAELPSPRSNISAISEWLAAYNAELIATASVPVEPDSPAGEIYLARLHGPKRSERVR
jgi:hypothetical protein